MNLAWSKLILRGLCVRCFIVSCACFEVVATSTVVTTVQLTGVIEILKQTIGISNPLSDILNKPGERLTGWNYGRHDSRIVVQHND